MTERKKPELLMPAGSLSILKTAFFYGADAVYLGGEAYGLRAKAKNFSPEEMKEGIEYAHALGKKVYITANIFAHNSDLDGIQRYFEELKILQPDGILISDPGVFDIACETVPEIPRHISTQANNTNAQTFRFWYRLGVRRVVAARELSLQELAGIRQQVPDDMEIEAFVHGSMCISYSGRCLLSSFLAGRDANRGACTHPCRWQYALMEETRPGEYFPVFENDRGTYIMNSKDLCMIDHIPDLVKAGVDSFKVEGRMKNALYIASVARAYRRAVDDFFEDAAGYETRAAFYKQQAGMCTNRDFTTGFFYGRPSDKDQIYENSTYIKDAVYLGTAGETEDNGRVRMLQKNKFRVGDTVRIMKTSGEDVSAEVLGIYNDEGGSMDSAPHASQMLHVLFSQPVLPGEVIRADAEIQSQES